MDIYDSYSVFCSSKDIIYGTNLDALCTIILTREFTEKLTDTEIYQMIGRIGRTGMSYHANILTEDDETVRALLKTGDLYEKENSVSKHFVSL